MLYARRGRALLERGQTDPGLADLARPEVAHATHWQVLDWHAHACLARGDRAGYRRACAALLARFSKTEDAAMANNVAWICTLAPGAVADFRPVVRLAERAVDARKNSYEALNTLGAALLRAGRYREAVARLQEALARRGKYDTAADELLLALAYQKLGQADEARRWRERATAWLERGQAPVRAAVLAGAGASGPLALLPGLAGEAADPRKQQRGWAAWLELQLLRREALFQGERP